MAALRRRFTVFHFLVLLVFLSTSSLVSGDWISDDEGEQFTEELLLKPLPDRKVLAHFHFQSTAHPSPDNGHHHHIFPKAIAQLVQKFQIRDLELSFTQGRWNYENWGGSDPISSTNAKPPGVELWATFNVPVVEIDATWKNLTHALSGLFCSSINFLESSTSYTTPSFVFGLNVSNIRYGALPREAICTENLTPWLKLLPCRDKAGLAMLLDRPSIYKGYYHSQKLRLTSTKLSGIILEQTLTVVLQPKSQRNSAHSLLDGAIQPSWSISSMFKRNLTGPCVLAKTSRILVELEKNIVSKLEELGYGGSWSNSLLDLSPNPLRVIKEVNPFPEESNSILFEYVNSNEYEPLDVGIEWKLPFVWSSPHAPFHASRFLMGSGTERGSIAISLQSTKSDEYFRNKSNGCRMQAVIFQIVPWYVKVYYHTLQIFIDRKPQNLSNVIEKIQVTPSEDKKLPGMLELVLGYPCTVQSVALTLDFDKGFLHIQEYPPDANQGFDIPSALVTFPNLQSSRIYIGDDSSVHSPLLLKFQEKNVVLSYTEVLLVPFTTPDFSMPYNVITFTCTVLALYFGSLLNVLRRRIGEEERLTRSKDATKRGLIPLIVSKITSKLKGQTQKQESPNSSWLLRVNSNLTKSSLFFGSKFLDMEGRIREMTDAVSAESERGIEKRKEVAQCDSDAQHAASHRAYPNPLAKYENVVADPELFKETLMKLHAEMGTKFMVPIIGGKGLDLHRLFVEVTSRGGIEKVVSEKRWREVTAAFSFPSTATNASFILRKYYLSLLHHYEQIYLFGAERWNPLNAPSNAPASSVASRRSLEPLKIYSEAQAAAGKRRKNSGLSSPTYTPVVGVIDGKFEHGYFVTVTVGSEKLKGVLYHIPEQTAEQDPLASVSADDGNSRSPHHHQRQTKLSVLDPNLSKQDNSGYNAFFAEQHARLLPLHPGQDTEISRIISVQWNELTETERAVYQERGMKDKERHESEMALCESSKPGLLVWDPLSMQLPPVKPVEEADVKLQKADGDTKACDEDHCSSEDIDSGGGSSQVHPEIESSADVTTIIGSMCSAEPSKETSSSCLLERMKN